MHRVGGTSPERLADKHVEPSGSAGQSVVEFAIVLPVVLLLMLLAVDFGRLFYTSIAVNNAAREAVFIASTAASDPDYRADDFRAAVTAAALRESNAQAQLGEGTMSVSAPVCFRPSTAEQLDCHAAAQFASGIGNQVRVSVEQPFEFITPLVSNAFGGDLALSATVTGSVLNPLDATIVAAAVTSPAPTPQASPAPIATATPGPTPTPTPAASVAPEKWCTVPDFYHTYFHDPDARQVWHVEAGFTGELVDHTGGKKIHTQSQPQGLSVPCDVSMVVSDK